MVFLDLMVLLFVVVFGGFMALKIISIVFGNSGFFWRLRSRKKALKELENKLTEAEIEEKILLLQTLLDEKRDAKTSLILNLAEQDIAKANQTTTRIEKIHSDRQ